MKQKSIKAEIRDKFSGKGNAWIKIPKSSIAYSIVDEKLNQNIELTSKIKQCFIDAGFAWLRFAKPGESTINPTVLFELRFQGSKIDHPDFLVEIPYEQCKNLNSLGTTPFKLKLENLIENEDINTEVKEIKEKTISRQDKKDILKEENIDIDITQISGLKETINLFDDDNTSTKNKFDYKEYINQQLKNVKEIEYTNASIDEINDFIEFLKFEGVYNENI